MSIKDNPQVVVQQIKADMVNFAQSGEASRLRGIIVAPEVWQALDKETVGFHGVMRVSGIEGNRAIRYTFYVLENTNFPHSRSAEPYFFVHHPKEVYEELFLGKEGEILASEERRTLDLLHLQIEELNPIWGIVEVNWPGGGHYYYRVSFDDFLALVKKVADRYHGLDFEYLEPTIMVKWEHAGQTGEFQRYRFSFPEALVLAHRKFTDFLRELQDEIYQRFDRYNLVHNTPETRWRGDIKFDEEGQAYSLEIGTCETFCYVGRASLAEVGRLCMRRPNGDACLDIVGVAIDWYGNVHEIVLPGSEMTTLDYWDFAHLAIPYFLPEEIFYFLNPDGTLRDLEDLRRLEREVVQEVWGDWSDPECEGRIMEYWRSLPEEGHVLSADFVDSRAKVRSIEIAFVRDEDDWHRLRNGYFPEDWAGWPKTRREAAFERMAASVS